MSTILSVLSGKGGVGKSTFTANLGIALASNGHSVVIVDTDIGLRSQDALLSVENSVIYDLIDTINGDCLLTQALLPVPGYPSLKLLPASQFARAKSLDPKKFRIILKTLEEEANFILIDGPAGVERGFRNILASGSHRTILLVTPDDLCIRDAERVLQIMNAKKQDKPELVVNRLDSRLIRSGEMYSARTVADLLDCRLLGEIPEDPAVYRSLLRHAPLMNFDCGARDAILHIASRLQGRIIPLPDIGSRPIPFLKRWFRPVLKEVVPLDNH